MIEHWTYSFDKLAGSFWEFWILSGFLNPKQQVCSFPLNLCPNFFRSWNFIFNKMELKLHFLKIIVKLREWIFKVCRFHKLLNSHRESLRVYPQVILSFWPKTLIVNQGSNYTYWLLHSCLHAQQDIWWHMLRTRNFSSRIPKARESWLTLLLDGKSDLSLSRMPLKV